MEIFKNGAKFVKIDCHLHTKSDKEFKYSDEENEFIKKYVNKLKEKNIKVGMITNHNKFNFSEFKALRSKAAKEEIFLIPGVELSVKEGKNGLHVLIAFSDEWINNGTDKINTFLDTVFRNVTENRENENTRSDYDLFRVIEELNRFNKDYFIIFAHVDQKSGLFNECDGGMITSLFKKEFLRDRTYGLQKSYNNDNYNKFVLFYNNSSLYLGRTYFCLLSLATQFVMGHTFTFLSSPLGSRNVLSPCKLVTALYLILVNK